MSSGDELDELGLTVLTDLVEQRLGDDVRAGQRALQLIVIGDGTLATHPLPGNAVVTIGRSNRCDISVDHESISRRHATLNIGETVTIEDLGSANGTFVRGNRVTIGRGIPISLGELVKLGKASIIVQPRSQSVSSRQLWQRDSFRARLDEECARQQRLGVPFAVLQLTFDRRAATTKLVEQTLGDVVRESDVLGRHGPHEYNVLLPDTPPNKADDAIRRLEGKLGEHGLKSRITAACCPRDGHSTTELAARLNGAAGSNATAAETGIVVSDAQMERLHQMVAQVASSQIGVLLLGETGVGKEVFARAIHSSSQRASGPFVEVNCAALTETLLESELFGHEKGAFTSATAAKPGLIEMADGGTIFLDEIGDMPLTTQVKLLRVIEDSQIRRVGGLKSRAIDVRVVAATNSNLEAQIDAGAFRRDLFFRLNGVTLVIPPLRERLSELEPLARAFIGRTTQHAASRPSLAPEALEVMKGYHWPGNVRELKHMMERAVLLCGAGPIRPDHLPLQKIATAPIRVAGGTRPPDAATIERPAQPRKGSDEEQQWIMDALERTAGNQTRAARLLGLSRRTLVNRLNEYEQVHRPRKDKKTR